MTIFMHLQMEEYQQFVIREWMDRPRDERQGPWNTIDKVCKNLITKRFGALYWGLTLVA